MIARQLDAAFDVRYPGASEGDLARRLFHACAVFQPGAHALLCEVEDGLLLLQVVVGDIEQRVLQIELDVGLHHRYGERQARRRAVGLCRRDARARRSEQGAVAAPEIQIPAEIERRAPVIDITAGEGRRKQIVLGVALAIGLARSP